MSTPRPSRPIPVGKLVSVSAGKATRTEADAALEQALPAKDRETPWLVLGVVGGVGAWLIALVVLAAWAAQTGPPARAAARPQAQAAPAGPVAAAPAVPAPLPAPAPDIGEDDLGLPVGAPVALARRGPAPPPAPPALLDMNPADAGPRARGARKAGQAGCAACEKLGTEIAFVTHPPDAFKQARREGKLVFMVHLSGNFEDRGFT